MTPFQPKIVAPTNRRSFLRNAAGATAAVATLGIASPKALFAATTSTAVDTPAEIFTAALIAEDLATTFYYHALIGGVIQDINLAGPGGTATHIAAGGSISNVGYIRAALTEEIHHANLFRSLLGIASPAADPVQTFYFSPDAFATLNPFITLLEALEQAFIAAYMAAIQQFGLLASTGANVTIGGATYKPSDLVYYAKIAASILGVESEHRALGRAISPTLIPANNLVYEYQDGIETVYNGPKSAVVALTPFLGPGNGLQAYSFADALANQGTVSRPVGGIGLVPE